MSICERWDDVPLIAAEKIGFPGDLRLDLTRQWVQSLQEFLAIFGEFRRTKKPPRSILRLKRALESMNFDYERRIKISDTAWNALKTAWMGDDSVRRKGYSKGTCGGYEPSLVVAVYEPQGMLERELFLPINAPIHDQGDEGSCVAHAVSALIEYLLYEKSGYDFLEVRKKLGDNFWKVIDVLCGKSDGVGLNGRELRTAVSLARDLGCWEVGERNLNPRQILQLKEALAGTEEREPSPIAATFKIFTSSCRTKASSLSGKWTLPFSDEQERGFHALDLWGYKDDFSVPGGGYFIARNSRGLNYACESPIHKPGFALIPYEYVQRFCEEAIAADMPIKAAPQNPYFPRLVNSDLRSQTSECEKMKVDFMNGIASNIQTLDGQESVFARSILALRRFFNVGAPSDLSFEVRDAMAKASELPVDWAFETAPREYAKTISTSASVKLWFVGDGKRLVATVGAFIAPLQFEIGDIPVFDEPTPPVLQAVVERIKAQIDATKQNPDFIVLALGTPFGNLTPMVDLTSRLNLNLVSYSTSRSHRKISGRYWETKFVGAADAWTAPFRAAARPTTPESLLDKIREVVNDECWSGRVTVENMADKLDRCAENDEIQKAFHVLVENGEYKWDPQADYGKGALLLPR